MKKRTTEILTTVLFLAFLVCMAVGTLIPKASFSQAEKRYLASFPKPTWDAVSSGSWGEDLETWMADHIPLRTLFVGLDAYKDLLLGQQNTKEIRLYGDRLVEQPVHPREDTLPGTLKAIRRFCDAVDAPVTLALVPSAGWAGGYPNYTDSNIIRSIQAFGDGAWNALNLTGCFEGHPELFYRTDHHWTSRGAYVGFQAIAAYYGRDARPESEFSIEVIPDCFQGSTYSRSALWLTEPEDLELWHGSEAITAVTSENPEPRGVFSRDRLEEADKYTVFLDGNHATVTLTNPEKTGKLLVIRDSYSNCLGCFLAESWGQVTLVDLRYYKQPISALAADADEVLILYSIGNFLSDTNLVLLR